MLADLAPWLKGLHFLSLLVWCGTLLAFPGIFAAHQRVRLGDDATNLRAMTRFTYLAIASPAAIIAITSGTLLIHPMNAYAGWLALKLTLVSVMVAFHILCGRALLLLHDRPKAWPSAFPVALSFVPIPLIAGTIYLVLAKPL